MRDSIGLYKKRKFTIILSMKVYILLIPVILFSLTVHEYMHGLTAYKLGDSTPLISGRLTMNPLSHLDPIGTIMLFIARFGWAKPVPVNPFNFRNPLRDMAIVASAGPLSNLSIGILSAFLIRLFFGKGDHLIYFSENLIFLLLFLFMQINLALAFFNLIPIPPLDGSKILLHFLPPRSRSEYLRFSSIGPLLIFGIFIFEAIFNFSIFGLIVWYPANFISRLILGTNFF